MDNFPYYRVFFERAFNPIAIYEIDRSDCGQTADKMRFVDINSAYEKVHGVAREDVIGHTFAEIWPDVEQCWYDIIKKSLENGATSHCESASRYTDGYFEAIAFPLAEKMVAVIFLDRSEWKKSDTALKSKQKELLRYRKMLQEVATRLTLSEEQTRRAVASDLHDRIGHALLELILRLHEMSTAKNLPDFVSDGLEKSIQETEQLILESRQLIFELSPPILLEVGLAPALEALADNILIPKNIRWSLVTRGRMEDNPAEDAICVILYRMSRELLINVIKHADAKNVHISINRGKTKIQVVIEDDGRGMPPKFRLGKHNSHSIGLFSIRERLMHIGGELQIVSDEKGTTVSMVAPLHLKNTKGVRP